MVMPIDSVLRDLFQWPGYELLSQAAVVSDMPRACLPFVSTRQSLNANGQAYDLNIQVDSLVQQQLRIHVRLTRLARAPGTGTRGSGTSGDQAPMQLKTLLSTTVTVGLGHTVVLGSTQPGGGRGGMARHPDPDRASGDANERALTNGLTLPVHDGPVPHRFAGSS